MQKLIMKTIKYPLDGLEVSAYEIPKLINKVEKEDFIEGLYEFYDEGFLETIYDEMKESQADIVVIEGDDIITLISDSNLDQNIYACVNGRILNQIQQ